jgi:uncharacterized protein YlzI (FlbEa/FlbD family)
MFCVKDFDIKMDSYYDKIVMEISNKKKGDKIIINDNEYTINEIKFIPDKFINFFLNKKTITSDELETKYNRVTNYNQTSIIDTDTETYKEAYMECGKDLLHKISCLELIDSKNVILRFVKHKHQLYDDDYKFEKSILDHWCFYISIDNINDMEDHLCHKYFDSDLYLSSNLCIGVSSDITYGNKNTIIKGYDTSHYDVFTNKHIEWNYSNGIYPKKTYILNLQSLIMFFCEKKIGLGKSKVDIYHDFIDNMNFYKNVKNNFDIKKHIYECSQDDCDDDMITQPYLYYCFGDIYNKQNHTENENSDNLELSPNENPDTDVDIDSDLEPEL